MIKSMKYWLLTMIPAASAILLLSLDSYFGLAFMLLALILAYYAVKEEMKENGLAHKADKGQVEA
ncbi:MAG: hypothetical protein LUQ65_04840 [Candidatus Helarchaeota archaeon]|nr:hypothetical protein [Candidatus Helarchaeota archaeon]